MLTAHTVHGDLQCAHANNRHIWSAEPAVENCHASQGRECTGQLVVIRQAVPSDDHTKARGARVEAQGLGKTHQTTELAPTTTHGLAEAPGPPWPTAMRCPATYSLP